MLSLFTSRPEKTKKRRSVPKTSSKPARYFIRPSDNRVVTAYKKSDGPGYVYHKRTPDGVRRISVSGTTYRTEKMAKDRAAARKEKPRKR